MATALNNRTVTNIGTTTTTIVSTGVSERYTVIGLSLTNVLNENIFVDVLIDGGYYLKDVILPLGTSLRVVTHGEKLILGLDTTLQVRASKDNAVDCIISYAAIYSNPNPDNVNFLAGNNITLTRDDNDITIGADLSSIKWNFSILNVADREIYTNDTLTFKGETNVDVLFDTDNNVVFRGPDLSNFALRSELRYFLSVDDDSYKEVLVEDTVKFVGGLNITTSKNESNNIVIDGPDISNFITLGDVQFSYSSSTETVQAGINTDIKFIGDNYLKININDDNEVVFSIQNLNLDGFVYENDIEWYAIAQDTGRTVLSNKSTLAFLGSNGITTRRDFNGNIVIDGPNLTSFVEIDDVYWNLYADNTFEPTPIGLGQQLRIEGGILISTRIDEFGTITIDGEPFLQTFEANQVVTTGDLVALESNGKVVPIRESVLITDGQSLNSGIFTINNVIQLASTKIGNAKMVTVYADATDADSKVIITELGFNGVVAPGPINQYINSVVNGSVAYDPVNDKFVIFYSGNAIVGEVVNGNDSSLQAPVSWATPGNNAVTSVYHPPSGNIVVLYTDDTDNFYAKAVVATVGTPITFGTVETFTSTSVDKISATYDPVSEQIIIAYDVPSNGTYVVTASVAGTTITINTADVIKVSDTNADNSAIQMITGTGKVVVAYRDYSVFFSTSAKIGIISGTGVVFESSRIEVFEDNSINISLAYATTDNRICFVGRNTVDGSGWLTTGVVNSNATNIDFDPASFTISATAFFTDLDYDPYRNQLLVTFESSVSGPVTLQTYSIASSAITTNAADFVGIAKDNIGLVGEGIVFVNGNVADVTQNLVPNTNYYVTATGGLTLNPTEYGVIGRAINQNQILLQTDAYPRKYIDDTFAAQSDTIADIVAGRFNIKIAADDSTVSTLGINDTIQFLGGVGITTSSDQDGNITIDGATSLTVNLTDPLDNITKNVNNVSVINFDSDSGFDIDPGTGSVKVKLNSTFKTWKVDGQDDLIAEGLDAIELIAGPGISIETYADRDPIQRIRFSGFAGFRIAVDTDSTVLTVSQDETFYIRGGSNITTVSAGQFDTVQVNLDSNISLTSVSATGALSGASLSVTGTANSNNVTSSIGSIGTLSATTFYSTNLRRASTQSNYGIFLLNDTFKTITFNDLDGNTQMHFETETGNILASGDITTEYTSDERLKDVISPIEDSLNAIRNIDPIKFKWNKTAVTKFNYADDKAELGFKAQQVKQFFPELVVPRGNTEYLKLDYQKMTVALLAALQELDKKVQDLERRLGL